MITQETSLQPAKIALPGDGKLLMMMGEKIHIKLRGEDTGGAYSVIEDETPPGGGPPLHVHSLEDETFYVLEGEYDLRVGEATFRATAGTTLYAPRGVAHSFRNVGSQPGRLLIVFSPPGFEGFFEDVDAAASDGPPAFETIVELAARYGNRAV